MQSIPAPTDDRLVAKNCGETSSEYSNYSNYSNNNGQPNSENLHKSIENNTSSSKTSDSSATNEGGRIFCQCVDEGSNFKKCNRREEGNLVLKVQVQLAKGWLDGTCNKEAGIDSEQCKRMELGSRFNWRKSHTMLNHTSWENPPS